MTQEVRVILQLDLEVNTKIDKKELQSRLEKMLNTQQFKDDIFYYLLVDLINSSVISIEEESEIYGTE